MLDRIAQYIARHQMFLPGSRLGVAVSGGADSVFLLHALRELASAELSVIHIEHGIRGAASIHDAAFVKELAAKLGLPFHLHSANVPSIADNQEQAARHVRQKFFTDLIAASTIDRIATGHTRSDQAETVLYRILRGAGLAGLAGILPTTKEGLVRPLLEIDRAEIEAWLIQRNLAWREDASNQNRAYARNRLRHEILPLLRETFNPNLDETLSNMATVARDEELYWEATLPSPQPPVPSPQTLELSQLTTTPPAVARDEESYWESTLPSPQRPVPRPQTLELSQLITTPPAVARDEESYWESTLPSPQRPVPRPQTLELSQLITTPPAVARDEELYWEATLPSPQPPVPSPQTLELHQLTKTPPAVARRLIRRAISQAKGDLRQIDFAHVERILEMARSRDGHGRVQLPGLEVIRSFEWIRLVPVNDHNSVPDFSLAIAAPGSVELPGSQTRITLQVLEKTESAPACVRVGDELDWQRLTRSGGALPSLELRNWRPGDQYQPAGQSKQQKIKNLFQQARIPLWERGYWPIITYNGTIVWTQQFGAAAEFAAGPSTRVVLRVEVSSESCNRASRL